MYLRHCVCLLSSGDDTFTGSCQPPHATNEREKMCLWMDEKCTLPFTVTVKPINNAIYLSSTNMPIECSQTALYLRTCLRSVWTGAAQLPLLFTQEKTEYDLFKMLVSYICVSFSLICRSHTTSRVMEVWQTISLCLCDVAPCESVYKHVGHYGSINSHLARYCRFVEINSCQRNAMTGRQCYFLQLHQKFSRSV